MCISIYRLTGRVLLNINGQLVIFFFGGGVTDYAVGSYTDILFRGERLNYMQEEEFCRHVTMVLNSNGICNYCKPSRSHTVHDIVGQFQLPISIMLLNLSK